jgi:hypothetical protein
MRVRLPITLHTGVRFHLQNGALGEARPTAAIPRSRWNSNSKANPPAHHRTPVEPDSLRCGSLSPAEIRFNTNQKKPASGTEAGFSQNRKQTI